MDSRHYKELLEFGLEGTSSNGAIEKGFMEKEARGWALDDARGVELGGCGGRTGTHTAEVRRGPAGAAGAGTLCRPGCWQVALRTGQNYPLALCSLRFPPGHPPVLSVRQIETHSPGVIGCHSVLPSTSFPLSSLGLPSSRLAQRGADVIQLARKHRLEKTHTVNLTGN